MLRHVAEVRGVIGFFLTLITWLNTDHIPEYMDTANISIGNEPLANRLA